MTPLPLSTENPYAHTRGMTEVSYPTYLRLEELLSLQTPLSTPEHPDELLFIIVHQASELWFKLIRHELDRLITMLMQFDTLRSLETLKRLNGLVGIVTAQLHALDTLAPQHFAKFRIYLGTSSGSQSAQFRAIELLSGLRAPDYLEFVQSQTPIPPIVQEAMEHPSLPELFDALLEHEGVSLESVYATDDHIMLRILAEEFLSYEEAFSMWRFLHVVLVERIIGPSTGGTGGSMGAKTLRQTLENRFFLRLWSVRAKFF